jgi:hypothetical protein
MHRTIRTASLIGLLLLATAGCGPAKLRSEHTFTVPSGDEVGKIVNLTAQSVEQTVRVEVIADKPVDVFVILARDLPQGDSDFTTEKLEPKAVAVKKNATQEVLTATIPAKTDWHVVVLAAAKTLRATGTLKLSN